jgi:hypothetical protein
MIYLVPYSIAWFFAFLTFVNNIKVWNYYLVYIATLFLFITVRFKTGYDWNVYESLFNDVSPINRISFEEAIYLSILHSKELFYVYLNSLLKVIFNNYIVVQFISSFILLSGTLIYLRNHSKQYAFVFAISFSWLMFSLYFSTVRQAISIGLFFFFLISYEKQKKLNCFFFASLAIGIQHSSLMYFMVYFLSTLEIVYKFRKAIFFTSILLLLFYFLGYDFSPLAFKLFPTFGIEAIGKKLDWYINGRKLGVDATGIAFVASYTIVIGSFLILSENIALLDISKFRIYNFALIFLPFQVVFLDFSVFRNRLLYVALPFSMIIISEYLSNYKINFRLFCFLSAFIISSAYYLLYLNSSSGKPFIPYNSYIQYELSKKEGDGLYRLREYILKHR